MFPDKTGPGPELKVVRLTRDKSTGHVGNRMGGGMQTYKMAKDKPKDKAECLTGSHMKLLTHLRVTCYQTTRKEGTYLSIHLFSNL